MLCDDICTVGGGYVLLRLLWKTDECLDRLAPSRDRNACLLSLHERGDLIIFVALLLDDTV